MEAKASERVSDMLTVEGDGQLSNDQPEEHRSNQVLIQEFIHEQNLKFVWRLMIRLNAFMLPDFGPKQKGAATS